MEFPSHKTNLPTEVDVKLISRTSLLVRSCSTEALYCHTKGIWQWLISFMTSGVGGAAGSSAGDFMGGGKHNGQRVGQNIVICRHVLSNETFLMQQRRCQNQAKLRQPNALA